MTAKLICWSVFLFLKPLFINSFSSAAHCNEAKEKSAELNLRGFVFDLARIPVMANAHYGPGAKLDAQKSAKCASCGCLFCWQELGIC